MLAQWRQSMLDDQTLLDANAVLRYLLEDIEAQATKVEQAIIRGAEVTIEVLAECVYVLEGVYHVPRQRVNESLCILLDEASCRRKNVAIEALSLYSASSFDFVDCVLAAESDAGRRDVLTFDKKLSKLIKTLDETSYVR